MSVAGRAVEAMPNGGASAEEVSVQLLDSGIACAAFVLLLAGTTSVSAQGQGQEISCQGIPAAVRAAFEQTYPKATIKGCSQEVENGKTAYEIASIADESGRDVLIPLDQDVLFYSDGKLVLVEQAIAVGDIPAPVDLAIVTRHSDGVIIFAEKVMRDATVLYEVQLREQGKSVEILFDADGNEMMAVTPSLPWMHSPKPSDSIQARFGS
jgi:hypothetical protein